MSVIKSNNVMKSTTGEKKMVLIVLFLMLFLASISFGFLKPDLAKDSTIVLDTIDFIDKGTASSYFWPVRLVTSSLYVLSILLFSKIFGSILFSWILLNFIFYVLTGVFFYLILEKVFRDKKTALVGTFFLNANYAMVVFGLTYLVDIGGWFFYILSLYCLLNYTEKREDKWLLLSAASVGMGGLFKEYAFQGFIAIFILLVYENYSSLLKIAKRIFWPAVISFLPAFMVFAYVFIEFDYSYFDWFARAELADVYKSRIIEYVKSIGSLLNFLLIIFGGGLYYLWKEGRKLVEGNFFPFIIAVIISALPAFIWPAITQRILFIIVPAIVIVSCFLVKKINKFWYALVPVLLIYYLSSLFMDSYILDAVNLPF